MQDSYALPRLRRLRSDAYAWRAQAPALLKVMLAFGMAALTGLAAQLRVPLPFSPVPVTGQVFAVLLAGVLCGPLYGGLSQLFYLGLGAAGVPWFAGLSGGLGVIVGPTGGYLVGFVVAAEFIARVTEGRPRARSFPLQLGVMCAGVGLIYLFGVVQLALFTGFSARQALLAGAVPFVVSDLVKAWLAAGISTALLPKDADDEPRPPQ